MQITLKHELNSAENYKPFPLSQVQQSTWFLYKLAPEGLADKLAFAVRVKSQINFATLKTGFHNLLSRHSCLRTGYYQKNNQVMQRVCNITKLPIEQVDASGWNDGELQENLLASVKQPFNLEAGLVARVTLFSCSPTDHVLLLSVHHIACDWCSLLVCVDELLGNNLTQSRASALGGSADLKQLARRGAKVRSYEDYVLREVGLLAGSRLRELEDYWGGKLSGVLPVLDLPMSQSRPAMRSYQGVGERFKIGGEVYQQLQDLAEAENVSLSVLLLTAFQVLLRRYTGEEDVLVGWMQAAQNPSVVGNATNLMVIRSAIADNLSFRELLKHVQEVCTEATTYQDYPFPVLVRQLQPDFKLSHPPICQVAFAYEDVQDLPTFSQLWVENSELEYFHITQQRTEFDLTLEVVALSDSLVCNFLYNCDLLNSATITRMVGHFENLLEAIAHNSSSSIAQLPLLNAAERHQQLIEWNHTQTDYDLSRCLHQLIETRVELTPNAVAVTFAGESLTYEQLNSCANQLAHYLQSLGVQPDVLVAICVERSLEMVVGLLGILKAGGAYVPVDPEYPQERIAYMLDDCQANVLLTQSHLVNDLPGITQKICLDTDWEIISHSSNKNPDSSVQPTDLAYVIYTSGSTGKPKGAMNTHRGICNRLLWMQETYQLNATDSVLQKTPFSFDVSVWEFFWPLLTGARLVMAQPGGHRDTAYLVNTIAQEKITTLHFVPSMLQVFLEAKNLESCQSLQRVFCSGEALPVDLQERFFARMECELHNLYGPTEAAIDVTYWQCQRDSTLKSVPIGRAIANTQLYILDSHLQLVPLGVTGELYIGGVGVARGYLNRPELTQERFITHPFIDGEKLYKTGDLARYLPDGNIEYIGRIDHQVKIRGLRIELGEIENSLTQHPQIREAVVITQTDHLNQQRLIAYIVTPQQQPTPNELRSFLKQTLPEYMVPSAFVVLESLPLNPSGKVDRRSLPQTDSSILSGDETIISPRNQLEQQLAAIWSEILNISPLGVTNNFFEIGGNSLSAVHLMSAIEKQFARNLPLAILFANGTIEKLAAVINSSDEVDFDSPIIPLQPQGSKRPFFCVHPAGGHVLCYVNLARYLGTEQPFYGLQAQGFNGTKAPLETIEDMASLYVKAMQKVQPEGPYQIGGWSFGGVVAYEVAQQLVQQGQEVSLLAVLDSYVPILLDKAKEIDNSYLVGVVSRVFGGMFGEDNLVEPEEIAHLNIEEKIDYIIDKAKKAQIFPPTVQQQNNRRILEVLVGTLKATYAYQRRPYPGKVTIFRASEKHIMAPDPTLVWVELFSVLAADEIEICKVPGHHYSFVIEPHVQVLAERLKTYLV
ncbi:MAG: amino acid adenylation domain-containing protein [Nostoc sp. LLA-1]|nr:amino acid adenylation domain-containing protein [Cyanocohniella sp. LLY]